MSDLLRLCTLAQEQRTVLAADLTNADRYTIEQCLAQKHCQSWFISKLFKHRHDNDESLSRLIAQHDNCPMRIAAIFYYCKPELLVGSKRHAEIKIADLDRAATDWKKLKKYNEDAKNLAHYISSIIFETQPNFYALDGSPFPFCDIGEAKMRGLYMRTPAIVFEKFSDHPQTTLIKAAYEPINNIITKLPEMSPTECAVVARRNDLTSDVKDALSKVSYQSELLRLCTLEEKQDCVMRAELINAEKSLIDQCINQSECQSWFLDKIFIHRYNDDNALLEQILHHNNCPWRIAAIIDFCKPELLEGTQVHAEIQLAHFDPDTVKQWNSLKQSNTLEQGLEDYIVNIVFNSNAYKQRDLRALYQRTPEFIFEKFKDHKQTVQFHALYQPIELISRRLSKMKASERALLPKRKDLTDELKLALIQDSSKLVKKNILTHTQISDELLFILAKDVNEPIAELALKSLPDELKSQLNKEKANAGNALDLSCEKSILAYLRLEVANSAILAQIASSAIPVLCCAATLHKSADNKVWEAAEQRKGLPLWAQIGLAQHSANAALLDSYLSKKNFHIQRALCDNPHLSLAQDKALVEGTKRIEIWAAIANKYIDDTDMLNFIINIEGNKSLWLSQLRRCLDPNVTTSELRDIHSKSQFRTLVLSRLIARNPKCSIPIMRLSAHYLPEDIARNPGYGLKLLEDPNRLNGKPYDDWKAEEYLTQGNGPEFFYDWYLNQTTAHEDIRRCARSCFANPNKLRAIIILNDSAMHRRFIHEETQKFSDYEYNMLAYIGSPTLKKNLLKLKPISKELVFTLLQDKDRSVVLAAEKVAKANKLKIPEIISPKKESKPAKLTLKSLGNKAARISLAKDSKEDDVLTLLVQDKLPDVRATLALRDDINNELYLMLLSDPIEKVVSASLCYLRKRQFNEKENLQVQAILKSIVSNADINIYQRKSALKEIIDPEFVASLYQQGDSELDEDIIKQTSTITVIESALFAIERGQKKIRPYWLAKNPNLTLAHVDKLLELEPELIVTLIESCTTADELLKLNQKHRSLVNKYCESIHFRFSYNMNLSADNIRALFNEIPADHFIELTNKHLHKSDDETVIKILKETLNNENFYLFVHNEEYSKPVKTALFEMIESAGSTRLLRSFARSHPVPPRHIDIHIKGNDSDLREAIAGNQKLTDEQLTSLLNDEEEEVWYSLFSSDNVDNERLPDWFIRRIASLDYYDNESIAKEFEKRALSLQTAKAGTANALMKQFNAKTPIKKFKQRLTEKGLMETVHKVIEEDEWDYEGSKIIGKITKTINYNRLTPRAAEYGYSSYDSYQENCAMAYYPDKFLELLRLLDIPVKG